MTVDISVLIAFIMLIWIRAFPELFQYVLFHYLCQGTASLEDCYFVLEGHRKRRCFLSTRWLNSIFLWISKLNSLALLINNFNMPQNVFTDRHLIGKKLKQWYVFLFKFSDFGKIKSTKDTSQLKKINLVLHLLILPTKWQNWLLALAFALFLPLCMKFMKPCRMDIKILLALQQDVRIYVSNLIYGVRLPVMWEIDCLTKILPKQAQIWR